MKKTSILAVMLTLLVTLLTPVIKADAATKFNDVSKKFWAAEQIDRFTETGVIKGYDDGTFQPNKPVTREEATIILTRALNLDTDNFAPINYKDINQKHRSYKEIAAVTDAGIMQGQPDGQFLPNNPLTRAQMAVILTNAFELEGNQTADFKDVHKNFYAFKHINAIYSNEITTGYPDKTFKQEKPTTRAEFVVFLDRALNLSETDDLAKLLKKVYANEQAINSYEFEGSVNLGLTLPESFFEMPEIDPDLIDPEMGDIDIGAELEMIAAMLGDIDIDITGSYQKDPMLMEATVTATLKGEVGMTLSFPMVMNESKMWLKLPNSPLLPVPEEMAGKFIEFDLNELAELQGQPALPANLDMQTEFAVAIYDLFFDHFTKQFYREVPASSLDIPSDIDVQKVVKFELTNHNLKSFVEILFKGFLPKFFELAEDPEYAEALGLTEEEVQLVKEELNVVMDDIDEIVSEINKFIDINTFKEYVVIDQNNFIAYDVFLIDLGIKAEGETIGIKLNSNVKKNKINEKVEFKHGIPDPANVIPFDKILELEEVAE